MLIRRPLPALAILVLTAFSAALAENAPAAVLPSLAADLGTGESTAAWSISAFAAAGALTAVPATLLTRAVARRHLVVTCAAVLATTTVLGWRTTDIGIHLVLRAAAGVAGGLVWSVVGVYAHAIAPAGRQNAYLATALFGSTLSVAVGMPVLATIGTWAGATAIMAVCALATAILGAFLLTEPTQLATAPARLDRTDTTTPMVVLLASTMASAAAAHGATAAFTTAVVHAEVVPVAFAALGGASLVGGLVAIAAPRRLASVAATGLALACMLAGFGVLLAEPRGQWAVVAFALWGAGWGPLPAAVQASATRLARSPELANAAQLTGYNLGLAGGPAIVGLLPGPASGAAPMVSTAAVVMALAVQVLVVRRTGRRARRRRWSSRRRR